MAMATMQRKDDRDEAAMPRGLHTTPGGYRRFLALIEKARRDYFAECAETEVAAESGDTSVWHDNFAFEENTRQKHQLARRVRDLQQRAASFQVCPLPKADPDRVGLGCVVTLALQGGGTATWFLAGFDDGDLAARRVAYNAPLGAALLGREVGDEVAWGPEKGRKVAEVVSIRAGTAAEDGEEQP